MDFIKRCCCITFARIKIFVNCDYRLNGKFLMQVSEVSNLEVMLNNKILLDSHSNVRRASRNLRFVTRFGTDFSSGLYRILYFFCGSCVGIGMVSSLCDLY